MKVIICGAGQVGWQIARHLSGERNDVTVIDLDPELVRRATDTLDVTGVVGFASYPDVLERAGAQDADMLIAATRSDEVNIVACQVAQALFSVPRKIGRLRARPYLAAIESGAFPGGQLPIDVVISPEREVAEAALRRLAAPVAFESQSFLDGRAQLLGLALDADCPVLNTSLRQLTELFWTLRAIVVGVRRAGRLFAPEPEDQLYAEDEVYLFAHAEDVPRALEIFGKKVPAQRRLVIVGGGTVGLAVARALERGRHRLRTRIIERNRARAEQAADALERTVVLNGDGLESAMLEEAGVAQADAILTVTDDDKANLLAAVRAKQAGCRMAIALINDPTLVPLMGPLGIDAYINPRASTVSSILRHIRHGRVRAVHSIGDGEAEVIEAQVLSTSPIAGQLIRESDLPAGAMVGGILKGGELLKPVGDTRIEVGDVLVIFAPAADVPEVERLLQVSIDFF